MYILDLRASIIIILSHAVLFPVLFQIGTDVHPFMHTCTPYFMYSVKEHCGLAFSNQYIIFSLS